MTEENLQTIPADRSGRPASDAKTRPYRRHGLPEIVRALKSFSAKRINVLRGTQGMPVWQVNYYEHIIRDDEEHNRIHCYIEANAANWQTDTENPLVLLARRGSSRSTPGAQHRGPDTAGPS